MSDALITLLFLLIPLAGALAIALLPSRGSALPRITAMGSMLAVLLLASGHFWAFSGADSAAAGINIPWIDAFGVNLHLAVDGLNIYLLLLTALLFPVVLASSWRTWEAQFKLYPALLLLLQASLFGTFLAQNLMLFFIFWEAVLVPMFILILAFGGERRRTAAMTFFLYTLVGSILLLAAIILLGVEGLHRHGAWSFEFAALQGLHPNWEVQLFVFCAIVLACAIKCPLFPFHSWLPLAYGEAPFSGTALMAGVLSKMGIYGLLKLALPFCPEISALAAPYLSVWAVVSIVYGAVVALRQEDYRNLIAYSSLSHMGYIVLGIFSLQQTALHGALFQTLSHGVAVAGLFLMLGLLEQRLGAAYRHTGALADSAPRLAVLLMLFILATVALPLTSGFTGEFMILFGAFQNGMAVWAAGAPPIELGAAVAAVSGMVLGAGYMLRFARAIVFGTATASTAPRDLNLRELAALLPLVVLILWVGIWPHSLIPKTQPSLERLTEPPAIEAHRPLAAMGISYLTGGTHGH